MRYLLLVVLLLVTACTPTPNPTVSPDTETSVPQATLPPTAAPSPTPVPPRVLTVCMGSEPASLFAYADGSVAARTVRQAIYDGPVDWLGYSPNPVILQEIPTSGNGGVTTETVEVQAGGLIFTAGGELRPLENGVSYYPSGCTEAGCAQVFPGTGTALIDQTVIRFRLLPGLQWSDGSPLTADDSVYAYEVAGSLSPRVRAELLSRTDRYQAWDETTVEWRGVPGYAPSQSVTPFFSPMPRHAWGSLSAEELLSAEAVNRSPLGWGPYQVDEWTPGDHITLSRNPAYHRAAEGLPRFDRLVFRFMDGAESALDALLAGECDYVDETVGLERLDEQVTPLEDAGSLQLAWETGAAWEQLAFGVVEYTATPSFPPAVTLLSSRETRQALARCIDRQQIVDRLFSGRAPVMHTYVPPEHPLYNAEAAVYAYDPPAANEQLQAAGWVDSDLDPSTPRVALGVPGIVNGTPLTVTLLISDEPEKQQIGEIIQESLAQCGVAVNLESQPWQELMAPGPQGPVFGRAFDAAQFGWVTGVEPACFLYTTSEIPGPYPEFSKGWGGANATGYSNPEFDQACRTAQATLSDNPAYQEAHLRAQAIFAEDLPALPLFARLKLVAARPDLCGLQTDASAESALWNLEAFDYGDGCQ